MAIPTRFIIGAMLCLACITFAIIRSNMSIIILAMTKNPYNSSVELPDYGIRYAWTTYEQSLVLGSYFWGSTLICSFAGVFSQRYGARYLLGSAFAIAAILSTISPVASQYLWLAITLRFLTGITMGTVLPSLHALVANWVPADERGKSMSGHIIEQHGWKYAYYVVAVIFAVFASMWFVFVYDSPRKHPRITDKEWNFIESKLSASAGAYKKPWSPFRSMFRSTPFWALLCFYFGDMCGYYFLLTSVPRYLSEVHSFNITSAGLLASIPYLTRVPFAIMFGYIGDSLVKRKTISTNAIRKRFSICSHFIPGCFLICITIFGDQPYTCVAFITVALCFNSAVVVTSMNNAHDLAPNFASSIYGFMYLVGQSAGYLTPLLVAYFTRERSTEQEWRKVFYVGAGIYMVSTLIFIIFGSGYTQKWNNIQNSRSADNNEMELNVKCAK